MTESSRTLPPEYRERSTRWADAAEGKRTSRQAFSMCGGETSGKARTKVRRWSWMRGPRKRNTHFTGLFDDGSAIDRVVPPGGLQESYTHLRVSLSDLLDLPNTKQAQLGVLLVCWSSYVVSMSDDSGNDKEIHDVKSADRFIPAQILRSILDSPITYPAEVIITSEWGNVATRRAFR